MTDAKTTETAASRSFLGTLAFTVFLDLVGFGMILPLLPFYAERFGATAFEIGLLFAAYSLAQFALSPIWGRLSDRWGRRPLLLGSICGGFLAYLLFAAAWSLAALFVARLAAGAAAANYTIAQACVADTTQPHERAKAMGWLGAAFGMGFIFGPALGALSSRWGVVAVPLTAAALTALNFVLVWAKVPESLPRTRRAAREPAEGRSTRRYFGAGMLRDVGENRSLRSLLALYGVVIFGFSAMEATLALLCEERLAFGVRETSWLFVFVGVVIATVQGGLIDRVVTRWGEGRVLLAGLLVMAAGLVLLAQVESVARLLLATGLLALGSGLFNPTSFSLLSRLAPSDAQGGVLGLARSCGALARVGGPIWGGWSFHHLGSIWPFLSAGSLLAVMAFVALRLLPRFWIQLEGAD
ncbi:MAG: MFS transporter [Thermoanaerobaculia bacterium]|nr:MFS transporter [Thermoanaerobaculia bacterium]